MYRYTAAIMTNECYICKGKLAMANTSEKMTCSKCGKEAFSGSKCEAGHYICDGCYAALASDVANEYCLNTDSRDPWEILLRMMNDKRVRMHGPEHHVLVGAALLAAYKNAGGAIDLQTALPEIVKRGSPVPAGFCGKAGCCGAAISAGMFHSILNKTTPLSGKDWAVGNLLTSQCLAELCKYGGPRCCKRDSAFVLGVTVDFMKEHYGIAMDFPEKIVCTFPSKNSVCIKKACPFHPAYTEQ